MFSMAFMDDKKTLLPYTKRLAVWNPAIDEVCISYIYIDYNDQIFHWYHLFIAPYSCC